ncbi:MAG TPA: hypothetical protein VFO29_10405 [Candidatus Rubrimentiphilum sp.]|nr:hypothetical protein [Candidatus Rubrimentiphilum sp.]
MSTLPIVLAVVIAATPTPAPLPVFQPPPTIIHEKVSPVCSTLHNVVLPLARMQAQYRTLTAQIQDDERQLAKYSKTKLQDGVQLYASKIDQASTNLIAAINQVEILLQQSYAAYPVGKVPKVDAMRQRVQNVIDLERATADRYNEIYGTIVDNYGTDVLQTVNSAFGSGNAGGSSQSQLGPPSGYDTMPTAPTPAPAPQFYTPLPAVADYDPKLVSTPPAPISAAALKFYRLSQLNAALRNQGRPLIQQALIAARDCDGS